jgi:hypothetical protein
MNGGEADVEDGGFPEYLFILRALCFFAILYA